MGHDVAFELRRVSLPGVINVLIRSCGTYIQVFTGGSVLCTGTSGCSGFPPLA